MIRSETYINRIKKIDLLLILFYFIFVSISLSTLYSIEYDSIGGALDFNTKYSRQFYWVLINIIFILIILIFISKKIVLYLIEKLYVISIILLLGLLLWGKKISGAASWYTIFGISIQPTEFVKITAILLLSKYLTNSNFIKSTKNKILIFFLSIVLPMIMILLQPDPGSAIVFLTLMLVFYKYNVLVKLINIGFLFMIVSILTILFQKTTVILTFLALAGISYFLFKRRIGIKMILQYLFMTIAMVYVFDFAFNNILRDRHRDRINVLINNKEDVRGSAYNINQSLITIASGRLTGKGYMKGDQTRGNFLPEQSTDFIFCTIAEERGFIGAGIFIILYLVFLLRILHVANRQKNEFNRVFGYSIVCIIFFQFFINIAMTLGILPVIGIPLAFISYGGSSITAFTILLFLFIRFDYESIDEW